VPSRRTLLILVLLASLAGLAAPAAAHTQIQRATPGPGEVVEGPVDFVVLEFLDPVLPTPGIEVTGPDGELVAGLEEAHLIADDVARVSFEPLAEAGRYRVDYTFVALDGATQEGAHQFTVEPGGGFDLAVRPLLAAFVAAVAAVLVVLAVVGRRRSAA
jgi:methionine-rich copper-binding protein CopC